MDLEEKLKFLTDAKKEYQKAGYWNPDSVYLHGIIEKTLKNFEVKDGNV